MSALLVLILAVPLAAGLLAWAAGAWSARASRWITVAALVIDLGLLAAVVLRGLPPGEQRWFALAHWEWIPAFGVDFHLGLDGLSLTLVVLTLVLGLAAVGISWTEIRERVGFFHLNVLWVLTGILGVFMALDLFLFFFFWELMLVPMYMLIGIWGHADRVRAAIKFFIFTQASGLLMLVSILGLAFAHRSTTGTLTFDYLLLLGTAVPAGLQPWLMLGFFVAFAVKLPVVPVHTWLPDAHTEAPTGGSVILAGLLLKTGAYGLLRFGVPLFPEASAAFAPVAIVLGVVSILYGAKLAFAQIDLKRLVAYTSVSHMGFVLLGIYAGGALALQGVLLQIVAHGLSTGGLFMLVGSLQERLHTRDLRRMGGLWALLPRAGAVAMILALASLGLPGLGNFVAEFLILAGAFRQWPVLTAVATVGLVLATVYSLRVIQRAFHGSQAAPGPMIDLGARELLLFGGTVVLLLWLGLYPQPVIDLVAPALERLGDGAVWTTAMRWE